jgi:hypothetical protein
MFDDVKFIDGKIIQQNVYFTVPLLNMLWFPMINQTNAISAKPGLSRHLSVPYSFSQARGNMAKALPIVIVHYCLHVLN